jgi:multiple sugar transport system substrate-binding protein
MRRNAVVLALALALAPQVARGADLVVWWEKAFYPQADQAVQEIVAAFEQETGKRVELVQPSQDEIMKQAESALQAGTPPDFLFSTVIERDAAKWAYEDRLVDLDGVLSPVLDLFDADTIEVSTLTNGKSGRRGLYALPMGRTSNHVHVWNSLLERAGFTLADIPQGWEAFWSFWCDQVQPAVRKAIGREDIWAVGLPMSIAAATDTETELTQFQLAYQASWMSPDRRVQLDDPKVRAGMVKAMSAYTEIWRKGCTPPDAIDWTSAGNNKAFLAQSVVMTANPSLSIPAALRTARPDDYQRNAATIDWPHAANGEPLVLEGYLYRAVVFKEGGHVAAAGKFVRFLAEGGWLAHWLDFSGDEIMPPMRKLVEQPFWLDPSDPHRMRGAIQILTQPHLMDMDVRDNEWRSGPIWSENVWGKAVHRVVTDGITPDQAVDEAVARIKQILSE